MLPKHSPMLLAGRGFSSFTPSGPFRMLAGRDKHLTRCTSAARGEDRTRDLGLAPGNQVPILILGRVPSFLRDLGGGGGVPVNESPEEAWGHMYTAVLLLLMRSIVC